MQKEGKNNGRREKIEEILRAVSEHPVLSEELNNQIDQWLLKNENDAEQTNVLKALFNSGVTSEGKPSKIALQNLQLAKQRLGMVSATPKIPLYRKTYFKVVSAAAVVVVALGISFAVFQGKDTVALPQYSVSTVSGINKDVSLPDGSRMWVNENSEAIFSAEPGKDRIVRVAGQARFDVKSDEGRPFHVVTGHLDVKVLGTDFSVREYEDSNYSEVILYRGAVKVRANKKAETLQPGDRLTYDHINGTMTVENVQIDSIYDWRTDVIFASQKTLPELLDMVANYYEVSIGFDRDAFPEGQRYSVGFERDDPVKKVMAILAEIAGGFSYEINSDAKEIKISTDPNFEAR